MNNQNIYKKLWSLLNSEKKYQSLWLLIAMIVGMILEMLGIGLIIPALIMISQDNLVDSYPFIAPYIDYVGNPSQQTLIIYGMSFIAGIYAIKAIFLGFLTWFQAYYSFGIQTDLSQRLFKGYMFELYSFHMERNSAQLIRNVTAEAGMLANVIQSLLIIMTEILVFAGVMALLLFIEPFGALLVMLLLGIAGVGFYLFIRGYILHWGEARQLHEGFRIQHLQQGLSGIKEIKLLGREEEFLKQYEIHNVGYAYVNQMQTTFKALPRFWLELLAILSIVILTIVLIGQNKPLSILIPMLGVFAAAAFRIMPSISRVLSSYQMLRYAEPVINLLHKEFELFKNSVDSSDTNISLKHAIKINNISYVYPNTDVKVLNNIDVTILIGSTVGFIGASGAGKSTIVDLILGLLRADFGSITVDDIDIQNNLRSWQDRIGYVPQTIYLTDDTLLKNVALGLSDNDIDKEAVHRAITAAQLDSFVKELPDGLESILGEHGVRLSGGQRQRIGIARALYHDPEVLVLDEATSALDVKTESEVMDAVRALHGNKTIIIVAHRLSTVEDCDYIYRLEKGRIIESGMPDSVLCDI